MHAQTIDSRVTTIYAQTVQAALEPFCKPLSTPSTGAVSCLRDDLEFIVTHVHHLLVCILVVRFTCHSDSNLSAPEAGGEWPTGTIDDGRQYQWLRN